MNKEIRLAYFLYSMTCYIDIVHKEHRRDKLNDCAATYLIDKVLKLE